MAKRKSRTREYRLVKCGYCKGSGIDPNSGAFTTIRCKACKGVGKVKVLVRSK